MSFLDEILYLLKKWDKAQRGSSYTEDNTKSWNEQVLFHLKKITEVL